MPQEPTLTFRVSCLLELCTGFVGSIVPVEVVWPFIGAGLGDHPRNNVLIMHKVN